MKRLLLSFQLEPSVQVEYRYLNICNEYEELFKRTNKTGNKRLESYDNELFVSTVAFATIVIKMTPPKTGQ